MFETRVCNNEACGAHCCKYCSVAKHCCDFGDGRTCDHSVCFRCVNTGVGRSLGDAELEADLFGVDSFDGVATPFYAATQTEGEGPVDSDMSDSHE